MTVVSKQLFYERIDNDNFNCSLIHFWNPSCLKANFSPWWLISQVAYGSGKFFLPIYIARMLFNYRKIKGRNFLKYFAVSELRSIVYGIVMAFLIVSSACVLRKIFGGYYYYNIMFFPGAISGLSLLVESNENHILDTLTFFNAFVETTINKIKIKKTWQTIIFMMTSGLLMHMFQTRQKDFNFVYFWFYTPPKPEIIDGRVECTHDDTCAKYASQGFLRYFSFAYGINILRRLIPRLKTLPSNPSQLFNILFNKANLKFGLFIGGYIGLYRFLVCKLTQYPQIINHQFHGLLSGFLSGMTYSISPNIQVLVVAISTLLEIFYAYLANVLKITNHYWQRQLLFMFCHGYLLHNRIFNQEVCSQWYSKMLDACTNNNVTQIFNNVIPVYFS